MDSNSSAKPVSLLESFGQPPAAIQKFISMEVDESNGIIYFTHSDLLPRGNSVFRSYLKTAIRIAQTKYPEYKVETKTIASKDFEEHDYSRQDELVESSKIQADIIQMISNCANMNASDIHIDTYQNEAIIRARINGELAVIQRIAKNMSEKYISVIYNTMCDVAESMYTGSEFQDAVFARKSLPAKLSGVRVTCGPSMNGPFMVLRLLYTENIQLIPGINPLTQLGYNDEQVDVLEQLVAQPSGIIFVSGPTGSGKSTTLKYIINRIAEDPSINFISVEDPPEYNIPGVRQMPIAVRSADDDRDMAFGKSIRSALRSDPDRIMIGEIRDSSSAVMAITCAQTGHQVWTTVHANGTFSILDRMLALLIGPKYSERQAVSVLSDPTIVNGLMFQRLAPLLCEHCKIPFKNAPKTLTKLQFSSLARSLAEKCRVMTSVGQINEKATIKAVEEMIMDKVFLVNRSGECKYCNNGIKGRSVVSELVYTTQNILQDVFSRSSIAAKRRWNNQNREQTLQANARKLILDGKLDPAQAINIVGPLEADIMERDE